MRKPNNEEMKTIYREACIYADRSLSFTHDYAGFEISDKGDLIKKRERIIVGRLGQLWVYKICSLNNIHLEPDYSLSVQTDKYDAIICFEYFDIKTTRNGIVQCQVASHLKNTANPPDYYCFLQTSSYELSATSVLPIGIVTYQDFWNDSEEISKGELLPGTDIVNKFERTNILTDHRNLQDFESGLVNLNQRLYLKPLLPQIKQMAEQSNQLNVALQEVFIDFIKRLSKAER